MMTDGPFAQMLADLDAELAQQQNIDAACELVADLGRALGFQVTRSPEKAAKMAGNLRQIEALEPGTLDRLGAPSARNAQAQAMDATSH